MSSNYGKFHSDLSFGLPIYINKTRRQKVFYNQVCVYSLLKYLKSKCESWLIWTDPVHWYWNVKFLEWPLGDGLKSVSISIDPRIKISTLQQVQMYLYLLKCLPLKMPACQQSVLSLVSSSLGRVSCCHDNQPEATCWKAWQHNTLWWPRVEHFSFLYCVFIPL